MDFHTNTPAYYLWLLCGLLCWNSLVNSVIVHRFVDGFTAMQLADNFSRTRVFAEIGARPTGRRHPQCRVAELGSTEYFECFVKQNTMSGYHLAGTCRMGAAGDNSAVVDPQLR